MDESPTGIGSPQIDFNQLDAQANAIIVAGVAATAGMGWLPAFIDSGWLVIANSGMVTALAAVYQYKWTGESARDFVGRLIADGGLTQFSVKGLLGLMELTGIGLPVGVVLNGTLNVVVTYMIGKAAQDQYKKMLQTPPPPPTPPVTPPTVTKRQTS